MGRSGRQFPNPLPHVSSFQVLRSYFLCLTSAHSASLAYISHARCQGMEKGSSPQPACSSFFSLCPPPGAHPAHPRRLAESAPHFCRTLSLSSRLPAEGWFLPVPRAPVCSQQPPEGGRQGFAFRFPGPFRFPRNSPTNPYQRCPWRSLWRLCSFLLALHR